MDLGLHTIKDVVEVTVWLVGAGALIIGVHAFRTSQKQLNFAVIVSCTERFQKIMPNLKSQDMEIQTNAVKQYIDLCHEELFYFKHGYLPEEIVNEWLDGMIYYLPHFDGEMKLNDDQEFVVKLDDKLLDDYPRVRHSFGLSKEYKDANAEHRCQVIRAVKDRLRKYETII